MSEMQNQRKDVFSESIKHKILIADDEEINREIMADVLQEYDALLAEDGEQALQLIREYQDQLSLILLDIHMPGLSGLELLRILREDAELRTIPVIVVTSDHGAEVDCLNLGAVDFITRPYPHARVIQARVKRVIELSEDRKLIGGTERDTLTGLLNREYFYIYAEQFDQRHPDVDMDAVIFSIHGFRMISERYGKLHADELLCAMAAELRKLARRVGGIVCRREADTFLLYCPHREDYRELVEKLTEALNPDENSEAQIRVHTGVYEHADRSQELERRFEHAHSAVQNIRGSATISVAYYDRALHEKELFHAQLAAEFHAAIREEQFLVFFQPKFNIRPHRPVLASAEALVRWRHPQRGMISPGVFIPVFEGNGLIQELDHYVWRKTAAQIRDWKQRFGFSMPISVNVSRIDMFNPALVDTFRGILAEYGLQPGELLLEITESAYTEDSADIIKTVNQLRDCGFRIEMDDFGSGYSSLNMISSLPIDALKLDMQFIRDAFREGRDTRLIEVIIEIAEYLGVPVIAEGVETEEQLLTLKAIGCQLVQGYYFSKPVPAQDFERFLAEELQRRSSGGVLPRQERQGQQESDAAVFLSEEQLTPAIRWLAEQIPGGFLIYHADETEKIVYVNSALLRLFGCENREDFRRLTGNTFRGMLHPEDAERACSSIEQQILNPGGANLEQVRYRILRRDGAVRWVDDSGRLAHMPGYGEVIYAFLSDVTERQRDGELIALLSHKVVGAHYRSVALLSGGQYTELFGGQQGAYCDYVIREAAASNDPEAVRRALSPEGLVAALGARETCTFQAGTARYTLHRVAAEGPQYLLLKAAE